MLGDCMGKGLGPGGIGIRIGDILGGWDGRGEEGDVGLEGILLCWLNWTGKGGCGWMPCRGVSTYAWDGRETANLRAGGRE